MSADKSNPAPEQRLAEERLAAEKLGAERFTAERFHFSTEVRVRLPETDAMGIVFHGTYYTYLEVGRVDYLLNLDLCEGNRPIRDFDNVVVCGHLDFKAPARLHDILTIDVNVQEIRTTSFSFGFRIRNKRSNELVAQGYTTHCALDEQFAPMRVPDEFRKRISEFEGF